MSLHYDKTALNTICRKYDLTLLILHGSYAKGVATPLSDIDVGILGEPGIIKERYFDILRDFSDILGDRFDPVFLNGAEPMITYHVARYGIPLYEKTKGLFSSFKAASLARYLDSRKFRLLEKSYIKAAIQKGE